MTKVWGPQLPGRAQSQAFGRAFHCMLVIRDSAVAAELKKRLVFKHLKQNLAAKKMVFTYFSAAKFMILPLNGILHTHADCKTTALQGTRLQYLACVRLFLQHWGKLPNLLQTTAAHGGWLSGCALLHFCHRIGCASSRIDQAVNLARPRAKSGTQ